VRDLQSRGYRVDSLHGDMTQSRRDHAMSKFRNKLLRILVATDVAARGIDVDNIEAVINYDVPQDDQHYVHRIGRTARMGKGGHAFTLVLPDQLSKLREIQEKTKTQIKRQITPRFNDTFRNVEKSIDDGGPLRAVHGGSRPSE
jgi:ATP-dependent RNA helicase DeaD